MSKEVNIPLMETQLYQLFPLHSQVYTSLLTRVFREETTIPGWTSLSGTGAIGLS